jgi:hypothetical protein
MPSYHNEHQYPQQENLDQWACPQCFKAMSEFRPPVYNAENCCCAEVGALANGQIAQISPYEITSHQYEPAPQTYHVPESNASSNNTLPCPEGLEREAPNLQVTNTFLALGPEKGLNESRHRRSASFHAERSPQIREWLKEQAEFNQPAYGNAPQSPEQGFLSQETYILAQSSMMANNSSRRSKPSYQSGNSDSSGEASFISWGVDPVTGVGAWIDREGNMYAEDEYPYGLTDHDLYDY